MHEGQASVISTRLIPPRSTANDRSSGDARHRTLPKRTTRQPIRGTARDLHDKAVLSSAIPHCVQSTLNLAETPFRQLPGPHLAAGLCGGGSVSKSRSIER